MQVPIRKSEQTRRYTDAGGPVYLTASGITRLKETVFDLEKNQLPKAIEEVQRTATMGDFSENAAYQEAKGRMRRIHSRLATLKDRLNRARPIAHQKSGFVGLGSIVVLNVRGTQKTFEIVGPAETDPSRGRISHLSPLGATLMDHAKGDIVRLKTGNQETTYTIALIR